MGWRTTTMMICLRLPSLTTPDSGVFASGWCVRNTLCLPGCLQMRLKALTSGSMSQWGQGICASGDEFQNPPAQSSSVLGKCGCVCCTRVRSCSQGCWTENTIPCRPTTLPSRPHEIYVTLCVNSTQREEERKAKNKKDKGNVKLPHWYSQLEAALVC